MINSSFSHNHINEKSDIYNYWTDLPQIKILTAEQYNKSKGVIRQAINHILSIGLEIELPDTKEKQKRHVLSAKEIQSLIESRTKMSIGKSNIYFHLQALEKLGLIQVIDVAVSNKGRGKKFSAYYGRTAKLFRFEPNVQRDKEEIGLVYRKDLVNLLKQINPDVLDSTIADSINKIKKINLVENEPFFNWLKTHENALINNNIDINEFTRFIIFLHIYDPEVLDGILKLKKLLQIGES